MIINSIFDIFSNKNSLQKLTVKTALLIGFIFLANADIMAQTTVNLAPCTNCNEDESCNYAQISSVAIQPVGAAVNVPITYETTDVINGPSSMVDLANNRLVAPVDGDYELSAFIMCHSTGRANGTIRIEVNGVVLVSTNSTLGEGTSSEVHESQVERIVSLSAGDIITTTYLETSGGDVNWAFVSMKELGCGGGSSASTATVDTIYSTGCYNVEEATMPNNFNSTTANTYHDIPGLSLTYNPVAPSSQRIVRAHVFGQAACDQDDAAFRVQLLRNDGSGFTVVEAGRTVSFTAPGSGITSTVTGSVISLEYVETNTTNTAITYKVMAEALCDASGPTGEVNVYGSGSKIIVEETCFGGGDAGASTTDTLYVAGNPCILSKGETTDNGATGTAVEIIENITTTADGQLMITGYMFAQAEDYGMFIQLNGTTIARDNNLNYTANVGANAASAAAIVPLPAGSHTLRLGVLNSSPAGNTYTSRLGWLVLADDCGSGASGGGSTQSLSYDPATDNLTISDGNTISIAKTPTYGMDDLDADFTITSSTSPGHNLSASLAVTLPEAGTYRVTTNTFGDIRTTSGSIVAIQAALWDNTNASIIGETFYVVGTDDDGDRNRGGSTYERFVTVTGPTEITLRVYRQATGTDICTLKTASQILYEKID